MPPSSRKKQVDALGRTYHPGDPLPSPDVHEHDSDAAWAMFQALQDGSDQDFASTILETEDLAHRRPGPALKPVAMKEVMFEARRNNRVCPMPSHWLRMNELLRRHAGAEPPPPIEVTAWRNTSVPNKRLCLRKQVQWAGQHRVLEPMFDFLRDLPEDKWHHAGD